MLPNKKAALSQGNRTMPSDIKGFKPRQTYCEESFKQWCVRLFVCRSCACGTFKETTKPINEVFRTMLGPWKSITGCSITTSSHIQDGEWPLICRSLCRRNLSEKIGLAPIADAKASAQQQCVYIWRPLARKSSANQRYAIFYWWLSFFVSYYSFWHSEFNTQTWLPSFPFYWGLARQFEF